MAIPKRCGSTSRWLSNTPMKTKADQDQMRGGSTLVEVMVSCVLLAIIAIGSAAYMYHARADVLTARNQRVALEESNLRLEELRASGYDEIKPPMPSFSVYFLRKSGTNWVHSISDPYETVLVNGLTMPMSTTVRYRDVDGGLPSYDYLQATVRTRYRINRPENVLLETSFAP